MGYNRVTRLIIVAFSVPFLMSSIWSIKYDFGGGDYLDTKEKLIDKYSNSQNTELLEEVFNDSDSDDIKAIIDKDKIDNISGLININKATKDELMSIKGIGISRADSIIEYREKVGLFSNIGEIVKVPGIGVGIFNQIKEYITV